MQRLRELSASLRDWVWGYDYFISYAHDDGIEYPNALKEYLERDGYRVCIDRDDFYTGAALVSSTRRRIRMSKYLIVVGLPAAIYDSEWVYREVKEYLSKPKRPNQSGPLIIDINETVLQGIEDKCNLSKLLTLIEESDWIRLTDEIDPGNSSPININESISPELKRSFSGRRSETRRLRIQTVALASLLFLSISAVLFGLAARFNANRVSALNVDLDASVRLSEARRITMQSRLESTDDRDLSLLLAAESATRGAESEARYSLLQSLAENQFFEGFITQGSRESHDDQIRNITFSNNGRYMAAVSTAGRLGFYEVSKTLPWKQFHVSHQESFDDYPFVQSVHFSQEDQYLLTCTGYGVYAWRVPELSPVHSTALDEVPGCDDLSYDSRRNLFVLSAAEEIHLYSRSEDKVETIELSTLDSALTGEVQHISVLERIDRQIMLIANRLCLVSLLERSVYECQKFSDSENPAISALRETNDGLEIMDNTGYHSIWRIENDKIAFVKKRSVLAEKVGQTVFQPGENAIATIEREFLLVDLETDQPLLTYQETVDRPSAVAFSSDGKRLVVGSFDGAIVSYRFDGYSSLIERIYNEDDSDFVELLENGKQAIVGAGNWIEIIELNSDESSLPPEKVALDLKKDVVDYPRLFVDEQQISLLDENQILVLDLSTGRIKRTEQLPSCFNDWKELHGGKLKYLANRDLSRIFMRGVDPRYYGGDNAYAISDIGSEHERCDVLIEDIAGAIRMSKDERTLAIGKYNDMVVWDIKDTVAGSSVHYGTQSYLVLHIAFSEDDRLLALVSSDRTFKVLNLEESKFLGEAGNYNGAVPTSVSVNRATNTLAIGTTNSIRLWDFSSDDRFVFDLEKSGMAPIRQLLLTSDGQHLLITDGKSQITRFDLSLDILKKRACIKAARNLSINEQEQYLPETFYQLTCSEIQPHDSTVLRNLRSLQYAMLDFRWGRDKREKVIPKLQAVQNSGVGTVTFARSDIFNDICWHGASCGFGTELMEICGTAASMYSRDRSFGDSWGLVQAINGKFSGAIEEFELYIKANAGKEGYDEKISSRRVWIDAMKRGEQPFSDLIDSTECTDI